MEWGGIQNGLLSKSIPNSNSMQLGLEWYYYGASKDGNGIPQRALNNSVQNLV